MIVTSVLTTYPEGRCADFNNQCVERRCVAQRCVFWGPENEILYFYPIFPKKTQKIFWLNTGFNMEDFISKHPLNDQLCFWKLDDEWARRPLEIKICG